MPEHVTDDWWGIDRSVPIVHALDALLDQMERRLEASSSEHVAFERDLLPMSTGVMALDRVLGGGVHRGTLTVVEADIAAQANALLYTVARHLPHPRLLDGRTFFAAVAWLMAGSADVAEVSVSDASLSSREWERVAAGLKDLLDQDLLVSSTGSLRALASVATASGADVLLVDEADRFGRPIEVVTKLAMLAASSGLAVIATTGTLGELPDWALDGVTRVSMHGYNLGGNAALLRPDADELLATAQVQVECLSGIVR